MFAACSSLTELNLTNFDTSSVTNMTGMFEDCTELTSILVSDKWKENSTLDKTDMFNNCGTEELTVI